MQWPFKAWGATAVLSGHDHTYERLIVDDFPYFVTGLGGRNIYAFSTPEPGSQARYNAGNGTMLVEASDTSIVFEFWSIADGGTLIDTYGLTRDLPVPTLTTMATLPPTATVVPTETPLPIATVAIATASTPPAVAPPAATATLLAPAPAPATARSSPAGRSIWVGVALIGALTGALVLLAAGVLLVRRH